MALDATVGGSNANSYVSSAEAVVYFADRSPSAAWDEADATAQAAALVTATRRLEQETFEGFSRYPLVGTATTGPVQALKWPRAGAANSQGGVYSETIIPEPIKRATFELAYVILGDTGFLADDGLERFDEAKVGPIAVKIRHAQLSGTLPENVFRELEPLLATSRANIQLRRG